MKRQKFTDESTMPWGEHKGTKLKDVPADYLLWLFRQDWIRSWPDLHAYLVENQAALLAETEEDKPPPSGGFDSLDDYMRYGR